MYLGQWFYIQFTTVFVGIIILSLASHLVAFRTRTNGTARQPYSSATAAGQAKSATPRQFGDNKVSIRSAYGVSNINRTSINLPLHWAALVTHLTLSQRHEREIIGGAPQTLVAITFIRIHCGLF